MLPNESKVMIFRVGNFSDILQNYLILAVETLQVATWVIKMRNLRGEEDDVRTAL
jgi:hypothetical protein